MKRLFALSCIFFTFYSFAQKCPKNSQLSTFNTNTGVTLYACVSKEVTLGSQSVLWGLRNNTGDELEVRFTKVVYTTCGNAVRGNAHIYLKPNQFKGGGTFFGDDIDLDTQVWKEDCSHFPSRISRIAYEQLQVINLTKKEQAEEAQRKQKEEEAQKQKEAEEQAKAERQKKEQEETGRKERLRVQAEEEQAQAEKQQKEEAHQRYQDSVRQVRYRDSVKQIEEDRTNRLERVAEQDNKEKAALAGIATGVVGLAASGTDNDKTDDAFYIKMDASVAMDNIPVITNTEGRDPNYRWSSHENVAFMGGYGAVHFGLRPAKIFEIFAKPFLVYGTQLADGVTGDYLEYGATAGIKIGGKFKVGGQVQYGDRTGTYEMDGDAVMAGAGVYTNDQLITYAEISHNYLSYGGFLMLETSDETDSYIQLGAGLEKPSHGYKEMLYYRGRFTFSKFFAEGTYIPDYPLDNKALYRLSEEPKKDYYNLRLGIVFNL